MHNFLRELTKNKTSNLSPICNLSLKPLGLVISTSPFRMTDQESSSSPSFMTIVPSLGTIANTITSQSSRRVCSVMLEKACQSKKTKTTESIQWRLAHSWPAGSQHLLVLRTNITMWINTRTAFIWQLHHYATWSKQTHKRKCSVRQCEYLQNGHRTCPDI